MKDFNELYDKVYSDVKDKLNKKSSKKIYERKYFFPVAFALVLLVILSSVHIFFFLSLFFVSFFTLIFYLFFLGSEKNKRYKNIVISDLIYNYDNNLKYNIAGSITRETYNLAGFEGYDTFRSEDSITGLLDGVVPINMSNILTQVRTEDSDGHSIYSTVFSGLFVEVTLNKLLNLDLKVHSDKGGWGKFFNKSSMVKMDSQEFEKLFDVSSSNKIQAMQLLTSDVMADLIDFKNKMHKNFEITIKNNKLYFRFHCGDIFESTFFMDDLDRNTLKNYYEYFNFCCELSKKLYNLIKDTDL